ncbi:uncharacterized protein LOC132185160 [Corylus avellana]|uniref:uncharacterized protein LOC132185160 n=1 Tax=Corylus avellana TaxID=13451 RepID=UPI00286BFB5C|nr:uncharacterized protein LOC132185160 [Corylus avellana]
MRRKIVDDSWCPVCGLEPETSFHILWACPSTKDAWGASCKKFQKSTLMGPNFFNIVEEVLLNGKEEDIKLFAGLSRQLWLRRNMLLHEGVFIHPNTLVQRADFGKAMGREYREGEPTGRMDVEKWKAPPAGRLKVNWDAALNLTRGRMGMGVVIRDHDGRVRAVKCSLKQGHFDPTAAETMAAIHALKFCMAQGMLNICMEGDAKNVVDALNSREENWSRTGYLVDEARNLLNGFNN